jgi:hypothetical protein
MSSRCIAAVLLAVRNEPSCLQFQLPSMVAFLASWLPDQVVQHNRQYLRTLASSASHAVAGELRYLVSQKTRGGPNYEIA